MKMAQWPPGDVATGDEFCPECGQPWGRTAVATAGKEKRQGGLIWPWILIAIGLYLVVSLMPATWTDYQFLTHEEKAALTATSTRDEFADREAAGIAKAWLTSDLQELSLAVFVGAVGMSAIARRKLETTANRPASVEVPDAPGRVLGKGWRTILGVWALGETVGMSYFYVILVIYALVVVGLLRHGEVPCVALLDHAWRVTFGIVLRAFELPLLSYP